MVSRHLGRDFSRTSKNTAPLPSYKSPTRFTRSDDAKIGSSDSKPTLSPYEDIQLELNLIPFDPEMPYWCTYPDCHLNFESEHEWTMHEEGHWAPKCYICLLCATVTQDGTGYQCCIGCSQRFGSHFTVDMAGRHILQCELAQERSEKFASYDRLCTHLQTQHDMKTFDAQNSLWSFPIESDWPRECGLCGAKFIQWEVRADHIRAHFLQDSISGVPLQLFNVENNKLRSMAKEEPTGHFPGDAWNTTCLAKPNASNIKLGAFESRKGIKIPIPDDCPAVVTDAAVGYCSCPGVLPFPYREWIRLRAISRALHVSRTKLLLRATGEWLWFTAEFQNWRSLYEHSFLWLCGSPGSGKSILTSAVIRYLEGHKKDGEVVVFYCYDGRYESSNAVLEIMGVLLAELQARVTGDSVVARLMEDVMDLPSAHSQLSRATLRSSFLAIKHNLMEGETLILVLDGLDEVQIEHELLDELLALTSQDDKRHRIKIFMSSRREFSTRSGFATPIQIDVDARTSIVEDMKDYTNSIVSKNLVSDEAGIAIRKIAEKSEGRFLCLTLLLLILPHKTASANLNDWLVNVMDNDGGNGPFTIYNYMYQSIPERHRLFAHYTLRWVLSAARPMYSWELLDAVNLELGTNYLDADIEQATGGLLIMSRTRTVNLVHLSLQGFLLSLEWTSSPQDPQETITLACLGVLNPIFILRSLDQPFSDDHAMDIQPKQPKILEIYAKRYWMHHYLLAEPRSSCISGLLHETLRKILPARKMKQQDDPKLKSTVSKTLLEIETARLEPTSLDTMNMALRIGASFGFYKLAKLELDMGATDHVISSQPENSLHLAAIRGHTSLVKLLIHYGADIASPCNSDVTPLFHAIASGHHELMQLLLEMGTFQVTKAQTYGTMEELRLEPVISEHCHNCRQRRASFKITKIAFNTPDETSGPIFIKGDRYLLSNPNRDDFYSSNTDHRVRIKWLPGASMYRALALAANLGIDHIRRLLWVAGNTFDPFDRMVSLLCQDFANMVIA